MTTTLPGFLPEQASAHLDESFVRFVVASELYPLEALYGAAYVFIDRCYVLLDRVDDKNFSVVLTSRSGDADAGQLRDLVGARLPAFWGRRGFRRPAVPRNQA